MPSKYDNCKSKIWLECCDKSRNPPGECFICYDLISVKDNHMKQHYEPDLYLSCYMCKIYKHNLLKSSKLTSLSNDQRAVGFVSSQPWFTEASFSLIRLSNF